MSPGAADGELVGFWAGTSLVRAALKTEGKGREWQELVGSRAGLLAVRAAPMEGEECNSL